MYSTTSRRTGSRGFRWGGRRGGAGARRSRGERSRAGPPCAAPGRRGGRSAWRLFQPRQGVGRRRGRRSRNRLTRRPHDRAAEPLACGEDERPDGAHRLELARPARRGARAVLRDEAEREWRARRASAALAAADAWLGGGVAHFDRLTIQHELRRAQVGSWSMTERSRTRRTRSRPRAQELGVSVRRTRATGEARSELRRRRSSGSASRLRNRTRGASTQR